MKLSTVIAVGALLAAGAICNTAVAADTATVTVSANIVGTCKFNSGGSVSFGALDQTTTGDATGTVTQPEFWCTKGASYTIDDDMGVNEASAGVAPRRMKHASLVEYIPYNFSYTASSTGTGKTSPITLDISASVVNADFVNASAGNYSDIVTLSITP